MKWWNGGLGVKDDVRDDRGWEGGSLTREWDVEERRVGRGGKDV